MDDRALEHRTMTKITLRLVPFLCACYLSAYLNRVNLSFAKKQMVLDLGFSDVVYGFGAGIFFIGYFLFEVPSNLILARVGARIWIARIMVVWGFVSLSTMFVSNATQYYLVRFLLGAAEAGFFPGIIYYLTQWFPRAYRSRTIAWFMTAAVLSSVIGAPLSGWLLQMDGVLGLRGWKWLFVIEALPALVLGVVVFLTLPKSPVEAKWLGPEEARWIEARLSAEQAQVAAAKKLTLVKALTDPRVLILCAVYLSNCISGYGLDFFQPAIVHETFPHASSLSVGFITAVPQFVALFAMIFFGRSSDRRGERKGHFALGTCVSAAGLLLTSLPLPPWAVMASMTVAVCGRWSVIAPFWGLTTAFLSGTAAAGAIALVNSIGNLGGFAGNYLMGWLKDMNGSYLIGLRVLSAIMLAGALIVLGVRTRTESSGPE
jgi:ACS family tartrate transporter-like MFS transporter